MARPPATPEQRQAQRQRIFDAAAELYAVSGSSAVTTRAVAERAGTSQGTIYTYFPSLGELLRALWAEPVAAAGERLEQLAVATPDPVVRIRSLLDAFTQFVFDRPDVHRGAMLYVRPHSQPTPDQFAPQTLAFYRLLVEALDEANAAGLITIDDPATTAELLWAALHGALALPTNADIYKLSSEKEMARRMTDLLITSLLNSSNQKFT